MPGNLGTTSLSTAPLAYDLFRFVSGPQTSVSSSVADRTDFWWNDCKPGEPMLFNSKIELGEKFFQEIITHPVPIDMNTLTALKRCALGLDLYLWLTYRTFALPSVPIMVRHFFPTKLD